MGILLPERDDQVVMDLFGHWKSPQNRGWSLQESRVARFPFCFRAGCGFHESWHLK
jgi:hypothetical protein